MVKLRLQQRVPHLKISKLILTSRLLPISADCLQFSAEWVFSHSVYCRSPSIKLKQEWIFCNLDHSKVNWLSLNLVFTFLNHSKQIQVCVFKSNQYVRQSVLTNLSSLILIGEGFYQNIACSCWNLEHTHFSSVFSAIYSPVFAVQRGSFKNERKQ